MRIQFRIVLTNYILHFNSFVVVVIGMVRIEHVVRMKLIAVVDISPLVKLDDTALVEVIRILVLVVYTLVHHRVKHNVIYEFPYSDQHFHLHF